MILKEVMAKSAMALAAIEGTQLPIVGDTSALSLINTGISESVLSVTFGVSASKYSAEGRKTCELHALGDSKDDSSNFLKAVEECGDGGVIYLPDGNYTIGQPLKVDLSNAVLDLHGWLSFTQDIDYWTTHNFHLEFQNMSLAFIFTGNDYILDGNDKGGINGGGGIWYSTFKNISNAPGRPMTLTIGNSTNVVVKNWSILQPQFWSTLVSYSKNVLFRDIYINATRDDDPDYISTPLGWVQNTDGSDTEFSHNVTYQNFVYQGGDDCLAFKPNSSMITARNISCHGGTGIAFGSIGQYEGVTDILEDIYLEDVRLYSSNQVELQQGLLIKSWIGKPIGYPPNGGGGGTGWTKNITIKDLHIEGAARPIALTSTIVYIQGDSAPNRTEYENTSTFDWKEFYIKNVTGYSSGNRLFLADCSKIAPCHDFRIEDFNLKPGKTDHPEIHWACNNFVAGPYDGLDECHPSSSRLELESGGAF